jgi:hypothetical protein
MTQRTKITLIVVLALLVVGATSFAVYRRNVNRQLRLQLEGEAQTYAGLEEYQQDFESMNPLVSFLPYRSSSFEVHYGLRDAATMAAFYPILIKISADPSDIEKFDEQVQFGVEQATNWIASKGFNIDDLDVEWRVEEF